MGETMDMEDIDGYYGDIKEAVMKTNISLENLISEQIRMHVDNNWDLIPSEK